MLEQFHVRRSQGQRQIRRQRRGDAETPRRVHDGVDAQFFRELHGRDVARAGQRTPQRDRALKFFIVIVRCVRLSAADGGVRQIHNRVKGRRARLQSVRVHINLERAADLPERLGCPVEFGIFKTITTNHGFDFAGRVVDRQ